MTRLTVVLASILLLSPALAQAQSPLLAAAKAQHESVKTNLLKTAEVIPENLYSYRPTPEVRTVAQLIGHIADATLGICGGQGTEKPAPLGAEKSMTTKAELTKALAHAMALCDKAIAGMDDTRAMEQVKFFIGGMSPRVMIIAFNTAHNYEHYGNLVTYMRMNKIVPPSSAGSN